MNWKKYKLDVLKADSENAITIGPFGSRMKSDCYTESGVPVIRGNNITETKELTNEFVYISEEKAEELKSSILYADDLFFPHRGAIGQVGIVPKNEREKYILSSSLMKLTCNKKLVSPFYLFYYFRSEQGRHELLKNSSTVGTPGIGQPLTTLKAIEISIPPLPEQRAIAEILSSIDDKIELNNQMNRTLEAMAQAIFKQWFVDFKFPPAAIISDGFKPIANNGGGKMIDSELGPIPEGWGIKPLFELADYINGRAFKTEHFCNPDSGLPIIKIAELKNGITSSTQFTKIEVDDKYYLSDKDILFSWSGSPNTSIDTFIWLRGNAVLNQHIFKVKPYLAEDYAFVFLVLKFFKKEFIEIASHKQTTGLGHVTINDLKRLKFIYPPKNIIISFNKLVQDILDQIFINIKQSYTLSALRDSLLPRLMSGDLRVPEEIVKRHEETVKS